MLSQVRRHNPSLTDGYYIRSFIAGLKDYIQHHLQCHKLVALSQSYWLAKRLEQANPNAKKTNFPFQQKPWKPWNKESEQKDPAKTCIAELKAASKCFKCLQPWVPGHGKVCKGKQYYSLVLLQDEEGQDKVTLVDDTELTMMNSKMMTRHNCIH